MNLSMDELRQLERLHVAAWPALRTRMIDGLLMRHSGGGSKRANSVSTIDFSGTDIADALDTIESAYAALGCPAQVQTFAGTQPPDLPRTLKARGYCEGEATTTMVKRLDQPFDVPTALDLGSDEPDDGWLETYLLAITPDRREANAKVLKTVPHPRRFFQLRANGLTLSTVLCVASAGQAVFECVATRAEARRQGAAREALLSAEAWARGTGARCIGLQVVEDNAPAIALYRSLGFVPVDTNRFWRKDV